jgi:hypothetical protein
MLKRIALILLIAVLALKMTGCAMNRADQLKLVAKDWCMTIRASQVLPVYPPSEDIQPGDVFLVQTPLSKQAEIYEDKGFLALDQLVTRLQDLNYTIFYKDAYWKGTYASQVHDRPGWSNPGSTEKTIAAPRAAFPTYNFSVDQSAGLRLAIPIQGIPLGLGLMGASQAMGTVTLKDAYTYGIDGEFLVRRLFDWWRSSEDIPKTLKNIVQQTDKDIYLRVVSRVYLVNSVEVGLTNIDALGAGVDVGAAQKLDLPDLSEIEPDKVEASIEAYQKVLETLSAQLNASATIKPGGAFRIAHASQRSVTLSQDFDRPLVIGYRGFDVKVLMDGRVSAPIPSFSVVTGEFGSSDFIGLKPIPWQSNALSECYIRWLDVEGNRGKMVEWLNQQNQEIDPADLIHSEKYKPLLERAAEHFEFSCGPS